MGESRDFFKYDQLARQADTAGHAAFILHTGAGMSRPDSVPFPAGYERIHAARELVRVAALQYGETRQRGRSGRR